MLKTFTKRLTQASTFLIIMWFIQYPFSVAVVASVPGSGTGKIIGVVLDSASREPVEFATVALLDPASGQPIDGTVCSEKGAFSIDKVPEGNFQVAVSFMGYETALVKDVTVGRRNDPVNLGTIVLQPSLRMLGEVTVRGQRSLIEEKVDRTIYNAELDATTQGGDATDVLRRVPMLSVDLDGNVSLRGNQNVTVLLNNKPSSIMATSLADALRQIPAEQIKSVEVITSPSARYDAEGTGGVINIITKKNTLQGLSLGINSGVGLRGSNLGLNGGYRKGKIGVNLGGFGRAGYNITGNFENQQATRENSGESFLTVQQADTRSSRVFGNYTLGLDYDINENNYIIGSVRFGLRNGHSFQDGLLSRTFSNDLILQSSLRNVDVSDLSNTIDVNLNYTHLFKNPQHEFSLLGLVTRTNATNNFLNDIYDIDQPAIMTGRRLNENDSYNEEVALQADYQTPLFAKHLLEVGAKGIFRTVNSEFAYFTSQDSDGELVQVDNPLLSNDFNYYQNIGAGYFSLTMMLPGAISFKGGARYEYTFIEANFQGQESIDIPSFGVFVPSINLSRKLSNANTIKAAYNRRVQRPSLRFLNPNVQAANPLNISVGNPLLDPELTDNFELGYSTYAKGVNLNLTGFVRSTNNAIQSIQTVLSQDTILTTYGNIGRENAYGVSAYGNVSFKKLSLNGGFDVFYAVLENNSPQPEFSARNSGWVPSYRLFGNYDLNQGWGLQFFGFYRSRNILLQGYRGGFGIYSLALQKSFSEKKGSVGLGLENFLTPTFVIRSETQSPTFIQRNIDSRDMFSVRLNFSYRIGKMNAENNPRKKRRTINLDDLKNGDGGDQSDAGSGNGGASFQRTGNGNGQRNAQPRQPGAAPGQPAKQPGLSGPGVNAVPSSQAANAPEEKAVEVQSAAEKVAPTHVADPVKSPVDEAETETAAQKGKKAGRKKTSGKTIP